VNPRTAVLRHLRPGDTVAVIAPAGPCHDAARLALIEPLFARHGLHAHLYPSCTARHEHHDYLSGSDDERLADVHTALADDNIKALFALRGGYGCARIVDRIDVALLRTHHKPIIGYSDLTTLHALCTREGLPSFHAPMPASDWLQDGAEDDTAVLFNMLMQPLPAGTVLAPTLAANNWHLPGTATGRLAGGNLAIVASLIGSPFAVPVHNNILFLEDVSEPPYRVDRLLTQLRLAGLLDAAAGFVLGSFTGDDGDATAVLQEHLGRLNKPLIAGWPAGHGQPNRVLPLGVVVTLDAAAGSLRIDQAVLA
jgi:muramoyltetrapeptide carboxypeptidase